MEHAMMMDLLKKLFGFSLYAGFAEDGAGGDGTGAPGSAPAGDEGGSGDGSGDQPPAAGAGAPADDGGDAGDGLPEITDSEMNAELEKKGLRNIVAMNRRMAEKIAKLEAAAKANPGAKPSAEPQKPEGTPQQPPAAPTPAKAVPDALTHYKSDPRTKDAFAALNEIGLDDKGIKALLDIAISAANDVANVYTTPISSRFQEQDFREAVNNFANQDQFKFAWSKIGKEVEDTIRKQYRPDMWKEKDVIESTFGLVFARHPELFAGPVKAPQIVDDGAPAGRSGSGSAPDTAGDSAVAQWAKQQGMEFRTQDDKQIARNAYAAYVRVQKQK